MIPRQMESFLKEHLHDQTFENRLIKEGNKCFIEFGPLDVDRLARLNIEVDVLGPRLVVCMWDEESPLEIGGYLVVDNLAMGQPSMGGIRMLPDVTPAAIHNLARGMTLKNAAANLPYGGGKSGIVADRLLPEEHTEVVRGFARLIYRYRDIYLPGPDVGTNDADMKTIAIENGLDHALSKPVDMGGNRIDELGAAAGSCIIALQALLEEMPRLRAIPQFANFKLPPSNQLTVLIQGFGAVGAHAARILKERIPAARVIGVSDYLGYLYTPEGLDTEKLFAMWGEHGLVTRRYYNEMITSETSGNLPVKYSTDPNDLLRESAFCLIPAAPIAHYLDTDPSTNPSMTVDRMGQWAVSIEGANTYSPLAARKAARARMERAVYRERGVLIATDYLVNSGGVIFAAQEHLIKTPEQLRIPDAMLGDAEAVEGWLTEHAGELSELAEKRLVAAEVYREEVIRNNMVELIDLLSSDADMLPYEAAEAISVRRIAASESDRTAADIMAPMPTIQVDSTAQQAASQMIEEASSILAVVGKDETLEGVLTRWDITRATALGHPDDQPLAEIMTREVITANLSDTILELVRKLEHYEISAMPVVQGKTVLGMINTDLLARQSLLRLLQSQG
ncbi:MAG: CBS domain-containing protein [Anaerolineales bacterium]|nr:CBS domain-containing protein [Chloroflexota bacterium]MBL6980130.1 CBS domain-containing protein [Anaerolineales bacterium]